MITNSGSTWPFTLLTARVSSELLSGAADAWLELFTIEKLPLIYFYAGLRVLLPDIIQVVFSGSQCGCHCFCSYKATDWVCVLVICLAFVGCFDHSSMGVNVHFTSTYGSQGLAIQAPPRLVVIQVGGFMNQACAYSGQGVKLSAANPVDP
ncbi:hypothetical protein [Pseudomonas sp. 2822-15]|uniref:hypothetical protein n=1 Tax=Pseudomonas sp. 2822-15 TaxID=1712677 RepID=UPI0015B1C526|nr:hypothetical protein [Pseudomonas sp. 2822-15]